MKPTSSKFQILSLALMAGASTCVQAAPLPTQIRIQKAELISSDTFLRELTSRSSNVSAAQLEAAAAKRVEAVRPLNVALSFPTLFGLIFW